MKKFILLAAVAAQINFIYGQKVKGSVIDNTTLQPLADVVIRTSDNQETKSDVNGNFTLNCSPSLKVSVQLTGYTSQYKVIEDCGQPLSFQITDKFIELNTIQVTETSIHKKNQIDQPSSVTRISEAEIKRGNGLFMADAVNTNTPGVYMQSRTTSGGQQFNIRGYGNGVRGTNGASSNFDTQGTKVYLNGIPVTNAEGVTVMDDIDFASIESVEILRGPNGTIYGNAIAGVVNLQTKRAENGEVSLSQNTLYGSYGLYRSTTTLGIGTERSSLMINYGATGMDGFMPHTATRKQFMNLTADQKISERQSISSFVGFSKGYDQRNGELTIGQYDTLDYSGNPAYIKNDAHSAVQTLRAGLSNTFEMLSWLKNTTSVFGTSQLLDFSSAGGWGDRSVLSYGFRSAFEMNFKLKDKVVLSGTTGIEWQKSRVLANSYKMGADSTDLDGYNTITGVNTIADMDNVATNVFFQWTLSLPKGITLTEGVGYNVLDMTFNNRLWGLSNNKPNSTIPKSYNATYNQMLSPYFGLTKMINKKISAYISYSSTYKPPVSSYFYIPVTGKVNTELRPELGEQLELGAKGSLLNNKLFFTFALYSVKYKDKMTAVTVQNPANTATLYSYITNSGSLNNMGIEALIKYELITNREIFFTSVRPFANMTYSKATYENFYFEKIGKGVGNKDTTLRENYDGLVVAGLPPLVFNAGIDLETKIGLYGNIVYNYRDAMYFTADNKNITDPYSVVNAKLGFKKEFKHFSVDAYVGLNNITGTQYYQMVFVNQLPDSYIPAPNEINFFGGLNLKYRF